MNSKNQNLFANPDKLGQVVRRIVALGVVCVLLFAVVSCEGAEDPYTTDEMEDIYVFESVTGTIIGSYSHAGWFQLLVQVDRDYPIGKTFEQTRSLIDSCTRTYRYGVFSNVIGIQMLEGIVYNVNARQRISFSYRMFCHENEDDVLLFLPFGPGFGTAHCAPPKNVPLYVVTDFQILN